ncbi:hypothetical protein Vadar_017099 [Vaccinium darrowii]|uniref:Uncharacterized protein n=1 Tax=Vaccinium darrowii TaxID=229202 RepID=A0ACB7YWI5_9ERIC|nr:hypothetical protein Vadar_017099 [Vaccinium darrowii]
MAIMNCIAVIIISISIPISCLMISFPDAAATTAPAPTNLLPHVVPDHAPLEPAGGLDRTLPIYPSIQKICSATSNPKVCVRSLGGPHVEQGQTKVEPIWALVQQANAGINATKRAIAKANRFMHMNDPHYDESWFQVCLKSYDSAVESWENALACLELGFGYNVAEYLTDVSAMTRRCEDAFSGGNPTAVHSSPLTKLDRLILKMASNALDFQKMIFPSSREYSNFLNQPRSTNQSV